MIKHLKVMKIHLAVRYSSILNLGKGPATKLDDFLEKVPKGGGVIFNPKIYIADFGDFQQGFLSMKLIQTSNFSIQNLFVIQLFW